MDSLAEHVVKHSIYISKYAQVLMRPFEPSALLEVTMAMEEIARPQEHIFHMERM